MPGDEGAIFAIPEGPLSRRDNAAPFVGVDARSALARIRGAADHGDAVAELALALVGAEGEQIEAIAGGGLLVDASSLYAAARSALDEGGANRALALLLPLIDEAELNPDPLLAAAVCATHLKRLDAATVFAEAAIVRGCKHPRAFCIAGHGAMRGGDRNVARDRLALAARLARRDPIYRGDLRLAQRLLLTLHFD